jgi:hypothetical protein
MSRYVETPEGDFLDIETNLIWKSRRWEIRMLGEMGSGSADLRGVGKMWTATPYRDDKGCAWSVDLRAGHSTGMAASTLLPFVLCRAVVK